MGNRLVGPDEFATFLHHSPEKVYVFSGSIKFCSERRLTRIQDSSLEKDIARASLFPVYLVTCLEPRTIKEFPLYDPLRRIALKGRLNRPEYPIYAVVDTAFE